MFTIEKDIIYSFNLVYGFFSGLFSINFFLCGNHDISKRFFFSFVLFLTLKKEYKHKNRPLRLCYCIFLLLRKLVLYTFIINSINFGHRQQR